MFNGKMKAVTFSYDDGVTQDIRLAELFRKYGLKATFNINSGFLGRTGSLVRESYTVRHDKVSASDLRSVYEGHEIAAHTLKHPTLTKLDDDAEIIRQVEEDRLALSELAGYEVIGFAYPGGGVNYNSRIAELIRKNTGVKYCRTTVSTHSFDVQTDLYEFKPTVYHHGEFDKTFELAEKFLAAKPDTPQVFYIWGHAYELDIRNDWDRFEELCRLLSGKDDIFYGTNREVILP
ncbi:MAG: polysaccharide deacetylase family protein [Clostridia bacterium]|nr:polysaccharide deacetylase family protein [Clostridia bacterium]